MEIGKEWSVPARVVKKNLQHLLLKGRILTRTRGNCGAGESRTRVQIRKHRTVYMLSHLLGFRPNYAGWHTWVWLID